MTTTVDRRVVEIDVKTARGMQEQMKRAADSVSALEGSLTSLKGVVASFAGGLLAGLSVGAFVAAVKGSIDAMEALGERAQSVGLTTEALSALSYQAEQTSISTEQLDVGLVKLSSALADMGKQSTSATKALDQLGIVAGTDTETALTQIADAFATMPDGAEKTALAVDIFGKAGAKLIPMLNEGSEGMAKFRAEAERLGIVIDGESAKAAGELNDQLGALQRGVGGMVTQLAIGLLPALLQIVEAMKGVTETGTSMREWGETLGNIIKFLTIQGITIAGVFESLGRTVGATFAAMAAVQRFDFRGALTIARELQSDIIKIEADVRRRTEALTQLPAPVVGGGTKPTGTGTGTTGGGRVGKLTDDLKAQQKAVEANNKAWVAMIDSWIEAEHAAGMATKSVSQLIDEQMKRVDQLTGRAAARQLAEDFALLDDALSEGRITFDEWAAGLRKITGASKDATETVADQFMELGQSIQQSIEGWSSEAADAVLDFATGAERDIGKMAEGIVRQFAKMALQKLVFDKLFAAAGSSVAGFFGSAHGSAFDAGGQRLALAHGGVVNGPTPFAFAGGIGVMGEAGPEAIMPLKRNAAGQLGVMGGGDITVNVINRAPGVDVAVERGTNGEREVTVLIQQAVADGFARGRFDSVLGSTYGLNRRGR